MGRLKLTYHLRKYKTLVFITIVITLSVVITGTYAWFSLVHRITNEFTFEPCDIRLIKLDEDSRKPLKGAVFDLYDENGQLVRSGLVSDENGEIVVFGLAQGKQYYFTETIPPYGYEISGEARTVLFDPDGGSITVYNKRKTTSLTVTKTLGSKDMAGDAYEATDADKAFPFAFTVKIGDDPDALYDYIIKDANGEAVSDYNYAYSAPFSWGNIYVIGSGAVKSGDVIYLRHGETAYFHDIDVMTPYSIVEDNYFIYKEPIKPPDTDEYGCEDETTIGHDKVLAIAAGWAGYGYNATGSILETGSNVRYENIHVPDGYEITISSLVVVDRIIAHEEDIDPEKYFQVTIEIGDDPEQQYYYEVVHLDKSAVHAEDYDHRYGSYYDRNDPTHQYHTGEGDATWTGSPSDTVGITTYGLPASLAAAKPPLHKPHDIERWLDSDGNIVKNNLKISDGNTIVIDLYHASAIVVYGIPVGTRYTAEQVDYTYIDGYMIDSTYKTVGTILPDLETLPDDDENTKDDQLLRVRADIYNFFVLPIMRTYHITKHWVHESADGIENPVGERPASTVVHVVDPNAQITFDSRALYAIDNWAASVTVPKYDPVTGELIDYTITEELPPDYVVTDIVETEDSFELTNTYAPAAVKPFVMKQVVGNPSASESFKFELSPITANAPMPDTAVIAVQGEGTAFFDYMRFEKPGTYQYRIAEVHGNNIEYIYDTGTYIMTVTAAEVNEKITVQSVAYTKDGQTYQYPVFTNVYAPTELTSLIVRKMVTGAGADKNKLFSFTAQIGNTKSTFTLKDGESRAFTDIPVGTRYIVTEKDYSGQGYTTSSVNSTGVLPPGGATATFTNTKTTTDPDPDPSPNQFGSLTVKKSVVGDGADTQNEFRFTVMIGSERHIIYLGDGESEIFTGIPVGTWYSVTEDNYDGYITTATGATGSIRSGGAVAAFENRKDEVKTGTLIVTKAVNGGDPAKRFDFTVVIDKSTYHITLADGERYSFADIPVGTQYSVHEATGGGYIITATGTDGTISEGGNIAAFVNTAGETIGQGSLTVTKEVAGRFIDTTKKFRFSVKIGNMEYEIYLRHGESYTFSDIAAGTLYRVREDDYSSAWYETTSEGAVGTITDTGVTAAFVNNYTSSAPPKPDDDAVQISGMKTWNHGTNQSHPASIVVYVMRGDEIVARKTVTAADNWSYTFNLPRYDEAGWELRYSINEEPVVNYTAEIDGYDIMNTYSKETSPQTGDATVTWVWFVVLAGGIVGLRFAVFHKRKK